MGEYISIVIPTFNRRATLEKVLPSLCSQSLSPDAYEILLVDSGSTDGTDELIKSLNLPNIRFFVQENKGRSGARNKGVEEAQGELIVFTDADIIADGSALVGCEIQVNTLEEYENVRKGRQQRRTLHRDSRKRLSWLYFLTGNVCVSREKLLEVGIFDENFTGYGHEDLELGYRLEKAGVPIRYNPEAVNYHWHPVGSDEQEGKMHLAGISTVRFFRKHNDWDIRLKLGMTPLSLGIHSLLSPEGTVMRYCRKNKDRVHLCREIVLQYSYLNGIKDALSRASL
jgi:glycosyltransferase involved in cell wall biosynthesis